VPTNRRSEGIRLRSAAGYPAIEELLRRTTIAIIPDVIELVLEHPGAVDTAIEVTQAVEEAGMALGTISGMHAQQPAQTFGRLAPPGIECTPLLLAHLVYRLIQRLHDMEAVDDERGIGTVMLDCPSIGTAHIATGPPDACFLPLAQAFVEEAIDGLAALSRADPQDTSAIQVIDEGGELAALLKEISSTPRVVTPRILCPSRTRAMIRCSRSDRVEGAIFRISAAAFWVMIWHRAQIRHSRR